MIKEKKGRMKKDIKRERERKVREGKKEEGERERERVKERGREKETRLAHASKTFLLLDLYLFSFLTYSCNDGVSSFLGLLDEGGFLNSIVAC